MTTKSAPRIKPEKVVDIFGGLPQKLASSDYIRRWDHALSYGALIGIAAFAAVDCILSATISSSPGELYRHARGTALLDGDYRELLRSEQMIRPYIHSALAYATGIATGVWIGRRQLTPYNHERHIDGDKVWESDEARYHANKRATILNEGDKPWVHIHPDVPICKAIATRGCLIVGGVGSGKSVALKKIIKESIKKKRRCVISDIKGDMTELFLSDKFARVFGWMDERSLRWDIAQDLNTLTRASAFFNGLVGNTGSGEGSEEGRLWRNAPKELMLGAAYGLMQRKPGKWTVTDLVVVLRLSIEELHEWMMKYYPQAANFINDTTSKTTQSIIQSLTDYVLLLEKMAMAWPDNEERELFSWRDWLTNNKTKQRVIIMQAADDKHSTAQIFAAFFNYMSVFITDGEALPDNENGRTICFFLDELPQFGRFDIDTFILVGRSKGFVSYLVVQDIAQLEQTYGEKTTTSLLSSIATKLYFWIEGDTAKRIAEGFGYKRIINTLPQYSNSAQGTSSTIGMKEESKAAVDPYHITNKLGKVFDAKGNATGVRGMLRLSGGDAFLLDFPFEHYKKDSKARISAKWTHAPLPELCWRVRWAHKHPIVEDTQHALIEMVAMFEEHSKQEDLRKQAQTLAFERLATGVIPHA